MSETEEGATLPSAAPEVDAAEPDQAAEGDDQSANREAAKYRRALRSAESERDVLRGQVQQMQRGEVERLAAASGVSKPASIWGATDLGSLLDADGAVDPDLARQAIDSAVDTLGLSIKPALRPDPSMGARGTTPTEPDSWVDLFAQRD